MSVLSVTLALDVVEEVRLEAADVVIPLDDANFVASDAVEVLNAAGIVMFDAAVVEALNVAVVEVLYTASCVIARELVVSSKPTCEKKNSTSLKKQYNILGKHEFRVKTSTILQANQTTRSKARLQRVFTSFLYEKQQFIRKYKCIERRLMTFGQRETLRLAIYYCWATSVRLMQLITLAYLFEKKLNSTSDYASWLCQTPGV